MITFYFQPIISRESSDSTPKDMRKDARTRLAGVPIERFTSMKTNWKIWRMIRSHAHYSPRSQQGKIRGILSFAVWDLAISFDS